MSEHWEIYADWNPWKDVSQASMHEWKDSDYHD